MSMKRIIRQSLVLCLIGSFAPQAQAVEFAVVGPRAAGMGGAGVAVTTDALATYWNPAGLAMTQTVDIRIQGTGQFVDRRGLLDTLRDIERFDPNAPGAAAQASALRDRINSGGTLSGAAAGGLYIKGHFGDHAFGFNVSDVATAGSFVSQRFDVTGTNNVTGQLALRGLEARQAAFSYAYAFADKTFAIGVTGKIIQGAAYAGSLGVQGGQDVEISENFGKARISTTYGIDVGAIYRPSSWLRFGVVAKDLNQPEFDAPDGTKYKLNPQVRGGMAVNPWSTLTLTADMDVTSNKTFVPGVKSQVLSLGAEQTILSEFLSFRVGAFKNVQDAQSPFTPTAGFGLRIFALRVDVGGGYDFRERGALASGSVSLTF
jgi:hypothetical protein